MDEKSLDDFFRQKDSNEKTVISKRKRTKVKRVNENSSFKTFFRNHFSFDVDVDLTNPTSVLYRRNLVISNIIVLANLIFTGFAFVGISQGNWIVTLVFFLIMFLISQTLKSMRNKKPNDQSHQVVIMYLQCIYVFLLAISIYVKVFLGFSLSLETGQSLTIAQFSVTQAAYLLIFFSLVISSLYQNPKLMKSMFIWSFVILTALHFSLLHPELFSHASSISELFNYVFVAENEIAIDIILRTIVLFIFLSALYISVSISFYLSESRKNEFTKRLGVEANFADVVESVFEAVKVYNVNSEDINFRISAKRVKACSTVLAEAMGYDSDAIEQVAEFATVHTDRLKELFLENKKEIKEEDIDSVVKKTKLATTIIKRLQLYKKSEDIVLAFHYNNDTDEFISNMNQIQKERISQIVLISEIYVNLRNDKYYKKALVHIRALELIKGKFSTFFNRDIVDRFDKYNIEISNAYDNAI